jgi:osmotically-inducible protein OsmY
MAEEGTVAVLEPVTPAEGVEAAPVEAQAEQPTIAPAETEGQDVAAETVEPEPEAPAPLTQADIDAAIAEKRKEWDSERQREVDEATARYQQSQYEQSQQQAARARNGDIYQRLVNYGDWIQARVEAGEDWKQALNPQVLTQLVQNAAGMLDHESWSNEVAWKATSVDVTFPGYKPSDEVTTAVNRALFAKDRKALAEAVGRANKEAYEQVELPKKLAAAKKDWEAQGAAEGRLNGARDAQARAAGERPTNITSGTPAPFNPDAVLTSTSSSLADKRAAFKAKHGMDPDF